MKNKTLCDYCMEEAEWIAKKYNNIYVRLCDHHYNAHAISPIKTKEQQKD